MMIDVVFNMDLKKLETVKKQIEFWENFLSKLPENYSQVIKVRKELDELKELYRKECEKHGLAV